MKKLENFEWGESTEYYSEVIIHIDNRRNG
jgi:hypothetical protein